MKNTLFSDLVCQFNTCATGGTRSAREGGGGLDDKENVFYSISK